MGQEQSISKCNFEDIQHAIEKKKIIIHTFKNTDEYCLILNTLSMQNEIDKINKLLTNSDSHNIEIYIYGKHCNDDSVIKKAEQLYKLGFSNIYVYIGGLFEWLCLQDIYGDEEFPTTKKEYDILKFKPQSCCKNNYNYFIEN